MRRVASLCVAFVDLNPILVALAQTLEASNFTCSLRFNGATSWFECPRNFRIKWPRVGQETAMISQPSSSVNWRLLTVIFAAQS